MRGFKGVEYIVYENENKNMEIKIDITPHPWF